MNKTLPTLALLAVFASPLAHAAMTDEVQQSATLRICAPGDYKPFAFMQADGQFEGMDVDLIQSLAASLGAKAVWVKTTWAKLMDDFTAGKCDMAAGGISVTLERQKRAWFSTAYMVNGKTPIVRCSDVARFQTLADIDRPGVRAIANPGGSNERFARANYKQASLTIHSDNLTIFDEVKQGRADVFVSEAAEALVQQRMQQGLCAVNPERPLQYAENGFLLPKGDTVSKAYVDQWLHLIKANGEYQRIADKWLK